MKIAPLLIQLLMCFSVHSHACACVYPFTHTQITMLLCVQNQIFKRISDEMQAFHISAMILLILVMKRHYSLKAICQK